MEGNEKKCARHGTTTMESVAKAAEAIRARGEKTSLRKIRAEMGGGSPNKILECVRALRGGPALSAPRLDIRAHSRSGGIATILVDVPADKYALAQEAEISLAEAGISCRSLRDALVEAFDRRTEHLLLEAGNVRKG